MSGISGSCGESLASQLFQQGLEQQRHQRLEQQRQLQQEGIEQAGRPLPGREGEPGQAQDRRATPTPELYHSIGLI